MKVVSALFLAILAVPCHGCTAGYVPISLAEYRLLMESPDNVSVERKGEWTLATIAEPWQCVHSHRGSITLMYKAVARYKIRTSDIEGEGNADLRRGEESPRGDH